MERPTAPLLILLLILAGTILPVATAAPPEPPPTWIHDLGDYVTSVDMSDDGKFVIVGTRHGFLFLFDSEGKEIWRKELDIPVVDVAISPDGRIIAALMNETENRGRLSLYSSDGGEIATWILDSPGTAVDVTLVEGEAYFIGVGLLDGSVVITDTTDILWYERIHNDAVLDVEFEPRVAMLATCSRDGTVALVDVTRRDVVWKTDLGRPVFSIDFNSDGKFLAAGVPEGVYLLDPVHGAVIWDNGVHGLVESVALGTEITYAGGNDYYSGQSELRATDSTGNTMWAIPFKDAFIRALDVSDDDRYIVVGLSNGRIFLFDNNGKDLWEYDTVDGAGITSLALNPTGDYLVVGSESEKSDLMYFTPDPPPPVPEPYYVGVFMLIVLLLVYVFYKRRVAEAS
ncbi:MAG: WD40 repeat domain-containing protein [Desulfurococcales archaeon]|nr:WD40 repeat domain-containing protein [Desulfurococcales archaeon]